MRWDEKSPGLMDEMRRDETMHCYDPSTSSRNRSKRFIDCPKCVY